MNDDAREHRDMTRIFDCGLASLGLLVFSPIFLLAALLVVLGDGRPILYRQQRVGKNGEMFWMLKFRTMYQCAGGPQFTVKGDPRVTRWGSWLRRLKIDELPQLINVLRGDMSVIGPRPEVPQYVNLDDDLWKRVLEGKPGITDLATLAFRHEEELLGPEADPETFYRTRVLPEKLRLNVQYQQSRSLVRDVKLVLLTARYSFLPCGFKRHLILRSLGVPGATENDPTLSITAGRSTK